MRTIIFILLILASFSAFSQEKEEQYYDREVMVGINFHTNGGFLGGVSGRYSKYWEGERYHSFKLDILNIKHPKEVRYPSNITGKYFTLNKQNYFFVVRPAYGVEYRLFNRADNEGVQVNGTIAGGPSIGILKPYYVAYNYSSTPGFSSIKREPYNPEKHQDSRIAGPGGFFNGIGESEIVPGFNLQAILSFQFGAFGKNVSGLEVGGTIEGFSKPVNIIPVAEQRQFYTSLFVTLFYAFRS